MLELAAAPHAHHVHVRGLRVAEQLAVVAVLPVLERVARNPVRALAEDALAVHGDRHLAALLAVHGVGRRVHVVDHLELAETDATRNRRLAERRIEIVERLVTRTVRPPEARTVHLQRERHLVRPARERHAAGGGRLADPRGEIHPQTVGHKDVLVRFLPGFRPAQDRCHTHHKLFGRKGLHHVIVHA